MMQFSWYAFFRSAYTQIIMLIGVAITLVLLHVIEYRRNVYMEPYQPVLSVEPSIKNLASAVRVGMYVNNFPSFSFGKNDFALDALVWFRFALGTESLKTVEDFSFHNGKIQHKSKPIVYYRGNDVIIAYQVRASFKTYLDYSTFPVGDHRLTIMLDNRNVTPHEMYFEADEQDFQLSGDLLVSTWLPASKNVQAGYVHSVMNQGADSLAISYPRVVFTIDFENNSAAELITLYFPLFVLFFIGFMSLFFAINDTKRFEVIAMSMPILVLDKLVIDAVSPTYFGMTKIDFVYFVLVFLSSLILLFQAYVLLTVRNAVSETQARLARILERLEVMTLWVFYGTLIVLVILLTRNILG